MTNAVPVSKGKVLLGLFNIYRFTLARRGTRFVESCGFAWVFVV